MKIDVSMLMSIISVVSVVVFGIITATRGTKVETKGDAKEMTTVIVKLENISNGITEIKSELSNLKGENKEYRERIVKVEESAKQAHKRIDTYEKLIFPDKSGRGEREEKL